MLSSFALPAVVLLAITSILLIIIADWRIRVILLSIQYVGVFLLISLSWPAAMAVSKLVAGWMAGAILGMALLSAPKTQLDQEVRSASVSSRRGWIQNTIHISPANLFYLIASILVGLFVISGSSAVKSWLPEIQDEQLWAGLLLIGMGILQLGFHTDALSIILGVLTLIAGYELLYSVVERSTLVAGMLAFITLGVALVGSYLILAPKIEEGE